MKSNLVKYWTSFRHLNVVVGFSNTRVFGVFCNDNRPSCASWLLHWSFSLQHSHRPSLLNADGMIFSSETPASYRFLFEHLEQCVMQKSKGLASNWLLRHAACMRMVVNFVFDLVTAQLGWLITGGVFAYFNNLCMGTLYGMSIVKVEAHSEI